MSLSKIPIFEARKEHFEKPDGFMNLIQEIRAKGLHKSGVIFIKPPKSVADGAILQFENNKLNFQITKCMRQKPKKLQKNVYDSTRLDPKNPLDPQVLEDLDWDWESWQASPHSEGRIDSPEHFWSFYDNLSQVNEEVLYANGIEMSFTEVQGINF